MRLLRCSEVAFALCPDRHLCGSLSEAVFTEGCQCDSFNQHVEELARTERFLTDGMRLIDANALLAILEEWEETGNLGH